MRDITENRLGSAIAAAQRLQLALTGKWEYLELEALEDDFDLVVCLLEEVNDELKPALEERARQRAKSG